MCLIIDAAGQLRGLRRLEPGDEVGDHLSQLGLCLVRQLSGLSDLFQQFLLRTADVREELLFKSRDPRRIHFVQESSDSGEDDRDLFFNGHRSYNKRTHST